MIVFLSLFLFSLFIGFIGMTMINKIIQDSFRCTNPHHIICALYCVFTTPSQVSFHQVILYKTSENFRCGQLGNMKIWEEISCMLCRIECFQCFHQYCIKFTLWVDSMESYVWKENTFHSLWCTFKNKHIPLW